jgi:hypothetical protein
MNANERKYLQYSRLCAFMGGYFGFNLGFAKHKLPADD